MSIVTTKKLPRQAHHTIVAPVHRAKVLDVQRLSGYERRKAILDRVLAALLLVPGLPIIGLLMLLVRLTSPGPSIFRQTRVGRRGRTFVMYKIRTMRRDAEVASGPVWTQSHDLRATPVGRVLRALHLDELPQLLNILKGEMSLVGPRPERPEFVHVLAKAIPGYLDRLVVRPGVTGLAQLNLRPDSDLNSVHRKLALDCQYIEQVGMGLDLRLLACTFFRMLRLPESWLLAAFGLGRTVLVPLVPEQTSDGPNGAKHAAATPANILIQGSSTPIKGNGDDDRRHKHRGHHGRPLPAGRSKPR